MAHRGVRVDTATRRRILVIEHGRTVAGTVVARLRAGGFAVETVGDGPGAVVAARRTPPDVVVPVVLDVPPPGSDPLEAGRRIQAERPVPMLMLTEPFSIGDLVTRVHALVGRAARPEPALCLGDLEIDQAERRVLRRGVEVHLTPTEFDLLMHLAGRPRTVLPRERLLTDVWGWADASGSRTVDSHVKGLRRKLGPDLIRTVHGVGYALDVGRRA
jgi:DNA-binding response OmpR family regulator